MNTTRATLLLRIRDRDDAIAWKEFHRLYAPLLYRYARARGLKPEDAEDVRNQCLEVVSRKIPTFQYERDKGGFKNWLYRVANGKVIDLLRKRKPRNAGSQELGALADSAPPPDRLWDEHWSNEHLKYSVEKVREHVSADSYEAFRMLLFDECSVEEVCRKMSMNANQVYKAKSRVLAKVRELLAEMEEDSRF